MLSEAWVKKFLCGRVPVRVDLSIMYYSSHLLEIPSNIPCERPAKNYLYQRD